MSKPSPDRARIIDLNQAGWTRAAIAKDFGLSTTRAGRLIRAHKAQTIIEAMRGRDRMSG